MSDSEMITGAAIRRDLESSIEELDAPTIASIRRDTEKRMRLVKAARFFDDAALFARQNKLGDCERAVEKALRLLAEIEVP